MSGAETLRRAAALMRERAEAATPGQWVAAVVRGRPIVFDTADLPEPVVFDEEFTVGNAEHIASWHPAVALAVADWLDREALRVETSTIEVHTADVTYGPPLQMSNTPSSITYSNFGTEAMQPNADALTVATAYLGEDQ